jgi:outer membrane usher protein
VSEAATTLIGTESWLAVSLNEQSLQQVALFVRRADGHLLAPVALLHAAHIQTDTLQSVSYSGEEYVPLESLKGLKYSVDEDKQEIAIDAPAKLFDAEKFQGVQSRYAPPPRSPIGGFLNYDLAVTNTTGGSAALTGVLEGSVFGPFGAGVTRFLGHDEDHEGGGVRLDSTWTADFPATATSLRLGDSITGSSRWWGGAVRFGGIQWGTDFSTRPGLITMPLPGVAGEAALPSTLDVFVNGALRWRNDVQRGPFRISDVPIVTGEGQIRLVVNDLMGRQQVITQSYYASPQLLRAGLSDFSVEAGFARDNYGLVSSDYGRALISGTDRIGFTDRFTGEVHGEVLQDQQTLGLSAAFLTGTFGVLSGSVAASHATAGNGELVGIGYDHTAQRLSFGANAQYATQNFQHLGLLPDQDTARLTSQAYATLGLGRLGSIGVSRTKETFYNRSALEVSTVRESVNVRSIGYVSVSATRTVGETRDTQYMLSITHPIDVRSSASSTGISDSHGRSLQLDTQRNLPAGEGYGYRVTADVGDVKAADAILAVQRDVGNYDVEVQRYVDTTTARVSASGSLVAMAGHVFASREIQDSFALADVPDQADVRVFRENQFVGQTNSHGLLLIPGLRAYEDNHIRIDQSDIPLDVLVDSFQVKAVPWYRGGVVLHFALEKASAALITVKLADGSLLPVGATVRVAGKDEEFPTAFHGEIYVTGLGAQNHLRAEWDGKSCEFDLPYQQTNDPLPKMGPVVCQ